MDKKLFGAEIKRSRSERGYTQETFAEAMELDKNLISNLDRGSRLPNRDNLFKIAVALNVSLDKHLGINESPKDSKMAKIVEKYHELPVSKQIALENIMWAVIENLNELK